MKRAAFEDNWRHVAKKCHPFRVKSVSLRGVRGLGDVDTVMGDGNLLVICGGNGSGKTTLLRCIHACLGSNIEGGPVGYSPPDLSGLSSGGVECTFEYQGADFTAALSISDGSFAGDRQGEVYYFEPSASSPRAIALLRDTQHLEEMVEAADFRDIDPAELIYAVGRDYDAVRVAELEFENGIIPHFEVEADGFTYSSRDMGLGEFAIFHLVWLLDYVPPQSLVMIEEPEAFISPRSQLAVADIIARYTDTKQLFTIFTTHSPLILGRVPVSSTRILVRAGATCELALAASRNDYRAVLGVVESPNGILFVEDEAAKHMVLAALRESAPWLLTRLSVVWLKGDSTVIAALQGIPDVGHPMQFAGALDGDRRGGDHKCPWKVIYLPGDKGPDIHMLDAVLADLDGFARSIGLNVTNVRLHTSALTGTDCHDWPDEFAKASGVSRQSVLEAMGTAWARAADWDEGQRALAAELVSIYDD